MTPLNQETPTPQTDDLARDKIAQTYLGDAGSAETQSIARARVDWMVSQLTDEKVLDIGCSEGISGLLLARKGAHVTGVDRNPKAIEYARELLDKEPEEVQSRVEFVAGDIFKMELPEATFGAVVIGEVLEHMEDPGTLLRLAHGRLKNGGLVILTTPLGYFPDPDHRQTFHLSAVVEVLRPLFSPQILEVVDGYIRFVGTATTEESVEWNDVGSPNALLSIVEESLIQVQKTFRDRLARQASNLDRHREKLREQRDELRAAQKNVDHLTERRERALKDAQRWLDEAKEFKKKHRETSKDLDKVQAAYEKSQTVSSGYRTRYERAVADHEQAIARIEDLTQTLAGDRRRLNTRINDLLKDVHGVLNSKRYRIGDAMVNSLRPSRDSILLPIRLLRIFREPRAEDPPVASVKPAKAQERTKVVERHRVFIQDFLRFCERVEQGDFSHFVIMFGGTTHIQKVRANRPIRLTHSLDRAGIPVLFNFHRWHETDHIPEFDGGNVFQSPIDKTPGLIERILAHDFGNTRCILVVSYPFPTICRYVNLANANGWATLYDCRDDWEEFKKVDMAKWYRPGVEKFVVNNCDTTCCVSRPLQKKLSEFTTTRKVLLSPNAYDPKFLTEGYRRRLGKTVKIGYFGHLTDRWFDWPSLTWIASQRPDYRFEVIGHAAPKNLDLPENVQLLGPKEHSEICKIAAEWNIGIIPFRPSRLADGVDPIKIYEYFGLGLPVVSFRMPQIDDYPGTTTVETKEEFVKALDEAIHREQNPGELQAFLAANTWDLRAQEMLHWANAVFDQPPCEKTFHSPSISTSGA